MPKPSNRLLYLAAALVLGFEGIVFAMALVPDVEPVYRAVYIDRTSDCYPLPVTGDYALGTTIAFGKSGNRSQQVAVSRCGWRAPADNGSWSDGEVSMLRFRVAPPTADLALELELGPILFAGVTSQRVLVAANGKSVASLLLDRDSAPRQIIPVPRESFAATDGLVDITLTYPDAKSPADLGLGPDRHRYAIWLVSLRLGLAAADDKSSAAPPAAEPRP